MATSAGFADDDNSFLHLILLQYGDLYPQVREGIIVGQVGALLQTVDA
jgi:hypothetical protein